MRILLASLLVLSMMFTVASAEMLITASPFGQGRWVIEGAYLIDNNVANVSDFGLNTIGAYVGYGVTSAFDVILQAGSANATGLPAGVTGSMTGIGLAGKYAILEEGNDMPVSMSVGAGFKSTSTSGTIGSDTGSQIMVGLGVSKVLAPLAPYAGVAYRSNTASSGGNLAQMDLTVGTAVAWSADGAVYLEYTMQSMTPDGGTAYTQGQMAVGVGYRI